MVDTFSYEYVDDNGVSSLQYLDAATAHYAVLGWVDDKTVDIMADNTLKHKELLQKLRLKLINEARGSGTPLWLDKLGPAQTICHASLYNIRWKADTAPRNEGHNVAKRIKNHMPILIGHSPMDSLRAFTKQDPKVWDDDSLKSENVDDYIYWASVFSRDLRDLSSVDEITQRDRALREAFVSYCPGILWKFVDLEAQTKTTEKPSLEPNDVQKLTMTKLRCLQRLRDACASELAQLQWDLFAEWWKLKTSTHQASEEDVQEAIESVRANVQQRLVPRDIDPIQVFIENLDEMIEPLAGSLPEASKSPDETFHQRKAPTVTVVGCPSAWHSDGPDGALPVRLSTQLVRTTGSSPQHDPKPPPADEEQSLTEALGHAIDLLGPGLGGNMTMVLTALVREWHLLRRHIGPAESTDEHAPFVYPLFYGREKDENGARKGDDVWDGRQPFSGLFVEWEAVYFHIPFDKWSLQPSNADGARWGLKEYIGEQHQEDSRKMSGRDFPLPEIGLLLKEVLEYWLRPRFSVEDLKIDLQQFPLLSFGLKGIGDHLTTRYSGGTHLHPSSKVSSSAPNVHEEALVDSAFTKRVLSLIGDQSQATPYAGTIDVQTATQGSSEAITPFKPVSHGQLVLTKLNIIDRFGQVVSAVDLDKITDNCLLNRAIYPYVSNAYACTTLANPHGDETKIANAVVGDQDNRCAFIDIPPSINQQSRLNANFVTTKSAPGSMENANAFYRPIYEQWENPVWGWVLINYAAHGIQFFLPDGRFYGQVLLNSLSNTAVPVQWQPSPDLPDLGSLANSDQDFSSLHSLIDGFRQDAQYLKAFIHMIGASLIGSPEPDASYSESMGAIIGRPLALVDFGVSLQLAQKPRNNESTLNEAPPQLPLTEYKFPCIFGDERHRFDGLVGYFSPMAGSGSRKPDFKTCYTYFPQKVADEATGKTVALTIENAPVLQPYYINPLEIANTIAQGEKRSRTSNDSDFLEDMSLMYEEVAAKQLHIFTAIMNPYAPLHIRTGGLLPTKILELAPWIVKNALDKITVFFPAGPVLVTSDPLSQSVPAGNTEQDRKEKRESEFEIPTPAVGHWSWMQPYVDETSGQTVFKACETKPCKALNEKTVLDSGKKHRLTALEGFLELKHEKSVR